MDVLPLVHLVCFVSYLVLAVYIFLKNPRSSLHRVSASLIACWALWSLGSVFLHQPLTPKSQARFFENVIALGWIGFPSFFLWFSLLFSRRTTILGRRHTYLILFLPPLFLLTRQWSGLLVSDLSRQDYGWAILWSRSPWPTVYFAYLALFIGLGLFFIIRHGQSAGNRLERRQSRLIFLATLLVLPWGVLTNIVLPLLGIRVLPDLADVPAILWAAALVYAMVRFRFLQVSPESAAEKIVSTMPDGLILLDPQERIVMVNRSICDLLGFGSDALRGRPLSALISGAPGPLPDDASPAAPFGEPGAEHLLSHANGARIPVSFASAPLQDREGNVFGKIIIVTDISRRRDMEEELKSSEARFRMLFEYAPDAYFIYDQKAVFLDGNRAAVEMTGYEKEDLIGRSFLHINLLSDSYKSFVSTLLSRNLAGERIGPVELTIRRKDGELREIEVRTFPLKIRRQTLILGIARDVTERKKAVEELQTYKSHLEELVATRTEEIQAINRQLQTEIGERQTAEETLLRSREKYKTLTENIDVGIYRNTVGSKGKFIEVNPALVRMFRYPSKEDLLNTPVSGLYQNPADRRTFNRRMLQDGFVKDEELQLIRKDKSHFTASVSAVVVRDDQGKVKYFDGIIEDITVRKRLEEQLRQSQKMEAVGRLSGGIAHDFNNLLTSIIGYSEISRMKLPAENPVNDFLKQILRAADHAKDLIQQLLAFSRKAMVQPRVINLNQVINDFRRILQRVLGENIRFEFRPQKDLGNVRVDPSQVEQIVMNLAVNSRDAMPNGGRLSIASLNTDLDAETVKQYPYVKPGRYVLLAVSDTGCGMTSEELSHVFEPFFTTKKKVGGTGLGLSTVYGIVKQNSGYINVYSEPDRGTTVKIYLPRVDDPADPPAPPLKSTSLPPGDETILIVEDEQAVREIASKVLRECGYRVETASSGEEALQIWKKAKRGFDLLLSDVVLPNVNGLQLAGKLREQQPSLKVLFMSGYAEDVVLPENRFPEDTEFIQKPFTSAALAHKIRRVLDVPGKGDES